MSSSYNIKNYRTSFQYQVLDKIHGQPTLDSILNLLRQLKINAHSVSTTLGGGQLGYLALILPDASYMAIPNARNFRRPTDPGEFIVTTPIATRAGATTTITAAAVTQQKATFDEKKRLYNECQAVEQALRQQIIDAVEPDYLEALRDQHTEMVQSPIPDIIKHLRDTYGFMSDEDLADRENELKTYSYDPVKTVDDVFNKIKRHQELAMLMNNPLTDKQQESIATTIFNRVRVFQSHLMKWNEKKDNERTLINLKKHMRESWNALNKVGALKIQDSTFNQANIVTELVENQQQFAQDLRDDLSSQLKNTVAEAMLMFQQYENPSSSLPDTTISTDGSINSATSTLTLESLMTTIQDLKKEITSLKSNNSSRSDSTTNKDINPRTGKPYKRYCWSHGCCAHHGRNCNAKKSGHKDEATFKTRMGGSNTNCLGTG